MIKIKQINIYKKFNDVYEKHLIFDNIKSLKIEKNLLFVVYKESFFSNKKIKIIKFDSLHSIQYIWDSLNIWF